MKRGFTLIELLVVIAIIAILAAILFPVFARAKESAQQIRGVSQIKQIGTAAVIYSGDYDDNMPMGMIRNGSNAWQFNLVAEVPVDWRLSAPATHERHSIFWANSIQPYLRNSEMLAHPGGIDMDNPPTTTLDRLPWRVNVGYNGMLQSLSTSQVANVSVVPMFWNGWGRAQYVGRGLSIPQLRCNAPAPEGCRFNPGGYPDSTNGSGNAFATAWFRPASSANNFAYGEGTVFVATDTSTKFRRIGAPEGVSIENPLADPFSAYDANGRALTYRGCRPEGTDAPFYWCYFRPDRDQ